MTEIRAHTHTCAHTHMRTSVQFRGNKTICSEQLPLASGPEGSVSAGTFGAIGTFEYSSHQNIITIIKNNVLINANTGHDTEIEHQKDGEKKHCSRRC